MSFHERKLKLIQAQPERIPLRQLETPIPLEDVKTSPLLDMPRMWLKRRGCQISDNGVESHIFFPGGTTQARQASTTLSERWNVTFPDGSTCVRMYDSKLELNCLLTPITQ